MGWSALEAYRVDLNRIPLQATGGGESIPWIVCAPVQLPARQWQELQTIGAELKRFLHRCWRIRGQSDVAAAFFGSLSDQERIGFDRLTGLEARFPILARPDLIEDRDGRLWIAEIDLHPAHGGMLQRMQEIHGQKPEIADQWAELIEEPATLSVPSWKNVVPEQRLLAQRVRERGGHLTFLPVEAWHTLTTNPGLMFLNCCTLSLLNDRYPPTVPRGAELVPPALLDWKGWLALAQASANLGDLDVRSRIPETYLLPLVPGRQSKVRRRLLDLTTRQRRDWIVKPSTAWGGQGFCEGNDMPLEEWNALILGQANNASRGQILQRKVESRLYDIRGLDPVGKRLNLKGLRAKICPYYLFWRNQVRLAGALLALRRSLKVHGARDAAITLAIREGEGGGPLNDLSRSARASRRRQ